MKHYKLVGHDQGHYEIHDDRDGSRFKVSKKELKTGLKSKIEKIPKFSSGAIVGVPESLAPNKPADVASFEMPQAPAIPAQPQAPQPMQNPVAEMYQSMPGTETLSNIEAKAEGAIGQEAKFRADQSKQEAALLDDKVRNDEMRMQEFEISRKAYEDKSAEIAKDIAGTKIDPNQYWNSLGTGGKIGAALSIMFGGLGAGLSKTTQNMAWETIQKQIDRDIEGQKADLGRQQTMLSDNLRMQGNMMAAEQATRLQTNAILQGQIAQIAAKSNSDIVKQMAQQRMAALEAENIPRRESLARMDLKKKIFSGQVGNVTPEDKINYLLDSPQEVKEAGEQLANVKAHNNAKAALLSAFDRVAKENTVTNRALGGWRETPAMREYNALLAPYLKKAVGKVSDAEIHLMQGTAPTSLEGDATTKKLRSGLENVLSIEEPETHLLRRVGIDPSSLGNKMPSETKIMNGEEYQLVPATKDRPAGYQKVKK